MWQPIECAVNRPLSWSNAGSVAFSWSMLFTHTNTHTHTHARTRARTSKWTWDPKTTRSVGRSGTVWLQKHQWPHASDLQKWFHLETQCQSLDPAEHSSDTNGSKWKSQCPYASQHTCAVRVGVLQTFRAISSQDKRSTEPPHAVICDGLVVIATKFNFHILFPTKGFSFLNDFFLRKRYGEVTLKGFSFGHIRWKPTKWQFFFFLLKSLEFLHFAFPKKYGANQQDTLVACSKNGVIWICYMLWSSKFQGISRNYFLSEYLKLEEKSGFTFMKSRFDWERLGYAKHRIF